MPTDYINPEDGLLWCGKCHTPKQCRVTAFGRTDIQFCTCECEEKRLATEKAERERQQAIANERRREHSEQARSKRVDLTLELNDGTSGHITGTIGGQNNEPSKSTRH